MELSISDYDDIVEIQHNLNTGEEIDEAIAQLRPEALIELREYCLECIDRQNDILGRIQNRLGKD